MLEPPAETDVVYLDWETGNSIEDDEKELDCALPSVHIHNDEAPNDTAPARGRIIRPYLRCNPAAHKRIAAGALLNDIFVILVAEGRFSSTIGSSAETWLLLTPHSLAYITWQ
jgi:hypothetical protein